VEKNEVIYVVERAKQFAEAYAAAYRIIAQVSAEPGCTHFAALKAMELASK